MRNQLKPFTIRLHRTVSDLVRACIKRREARSKCRRSSVIIIITFLFGAGRRLVFQCGKFGGDAPIQKLAGRAKPLARRAWSFPHNIKHASMAHHKIFAILDFAGAE
jgi:hypothetical protein